MKTKPFDIAEYLETDDDIREFLIEILATGTSADVKQALNIAVRAKGMAINIEDNLNFDVVRQIIDRLGYRLTLVGHQPVRV